jgi:heme exporter protein B
MWRDARLVAGKDLRIEWRSRVLTNQVLPFAVLVLMLFAFALDPAREQILRTATPGLYWVAVIFSAVLAAQRSASLEVADGGSDALRLSGLDPAGVFVGKTAALAVQLAVLEVVLLAGVVLLYQLNIRASGVAVIGVTCVATTLGLAAASTLYGALAAGQRVRDTLLPLLVLPVVAPLLISSTRAFEEALGSAVPEDKVNTVNPADGWPWIGMLTVFALVYVAAGLLAYGPLQEEA